MGVGSVITEAVGDAGLKDLGTLRTSVAGELTPAPRSVNA